MQRYDTRTKRRICAQCGCFQPINYNYLHLVVDIDKMSNDSTFLYFKNKFTACFCPHEGEKSKDLWGRQQLSFFFSLLVLVLLIGGSQITSYCILVWLQNQNHKTFYHPFIIPLKDEWGRCLLLKWKPDRDADRRVISRHLCVSDGKGGGGGKRGGGKDWWSRLQKVRHACTNIKVKLLYSFIALTEDSLLLFHF